MATGQRALYETEGEFEDELEFEDEGEEFLGTVARGNGSLPGAGQREFEDEDETAYETEYEGQYEDEYEFENEFEAEFEDEFEDEDESEEFLQGMIRASRLWLRRAAPVLRRVVRVAAPIVGAAVGGPLGAKVARAAVRLPGDGPGRPRDDTPPSDAQPSGDSAAPPTDGEYEYEAEYEGEFEWEFEDEDMAALPPSRAMAELMAAVAARSSSEAEAEAMIGAATVSALSQAERAKLDRVLANLVRGSAALVRVLYRNPTTRPAIRVVPSVIRSTARALTRQVAAGRPVTPRHAARVMANRTMRVLGRPSVTQRALGTNARGTAAAAFADDPRRAPRRLRRAMPLRRAPRTRRWPPRRVQVQARGRAVSDYDDYLAAGPQHTARYY